MLEVYPGAYEEARSKLLDMLKQFDKTPPAATETNEDLLEDDSNLSAVEKL